MTQYKKRAVLIALSLTLITVFIVLLALLAPEIPVCPETTGMIEQTNFYEDENGNTYENTRQYFTLVTDEEDYEDYEWNSTNVTFVPQDPSEFYVVRLTLKDTGLSNQVTDSFLVVRASARAAEIYGEDNWVQNNIASIVLFSVAGVFFITFVVLLIVKPKDKGDIDVIAADVEQKKAKKSKK